MGRSGREVAAGAAHNAGAPSALLAAACPPLSADEIAAGASRAKRIYATNWLADRVAAESQAAEIGAGAHCAVAMLREETANFSNLRAVRSDEAVEVLRYLPTQPVSEDDLRLQLEMAEGDGHPLHEVPSEGRVGALFELLGVARSGIGEATLARAIDRIVAQKLETAQRGAHARRQEQAVRALAADLGFRPRTATCKLEMDTSAHTTFSGLERLVGLHTGEYTPKEARIRTGNRVSKADCVVRANPQVLAAIECKLSGTESNGHKRLTKEIGDKTHEWVEVFGPAHVVPIAVIGGAFAERDIAAAQEKGAVIIFEHDLSRLKTLLVALREADGDAPLWDRCGEALQGRLAL